MTAPKIILVVLMIASVTVSIVDHNKPRLNKNYNFFETFSKVIVVTGLLLWGGFF